MGPEAVVLLVAIAVAAGVGLRRIIRGAAPQTPEKADAIVVFGAAVWPTGPSPALAMRVARAAQLYAEGWAPTILCSGGRSDGRSEAQVMRRLLMEHGTPDGVVIPDDDGVTTRATLRSVQGFGQAGRRPQIIAVSSPYHMYRIAREGQRQGVEIILCPVVRPGARTWRLVVYDARQYLRELIAVPSYAFSWQLEKACRSGPGRLVRGAYRQIRARLKYLAGEADAVAAAGDTIAQQIKARVTHFSDTQTVLTPASGLRWPARGSLGDRFGLRHGRLHSGIDVRAAHGTPVVAAAVGVVLIAGYLGPYGNMVVIDHGGGLTTVYAHLAGHIVAEGEQVADGQRLGFVGQTGRGSGPHLHFEVRLHGSAVDPTVYLPRQA